LTYQRGEAFTLDQHPYHCIAPLGDLSPGNHVLELFDADARELTLLRRITIKEQK
jgi:hypothetical protein